MKRQNIRKLFIILSLLLFPITLYYFSPVLIINAGLEGIINGSFIVFLLLFFLSIPFGRIFCAYVCPAGGLQECVFAINDRNPKQGWRNYIKYLIWLIWIGLVIFSYYYKGEITGVDFFYETDHGISISNIYSYIIYYGVIFLIFIPSIFGGKRAFCHYFCWMAPFMVFGTKLRSLLRLPGLHVASDKEKCISCGRCDRSCPMGVEVKNMVKEGRIRNMECIQCGECVNACPQKVLCYKIKK